MNSSEALRNEQVKFSGDSSTARKINNLLNSSRSRTEGLQLLDFFLPQCSSEDFLQFCISWMQNCCKIDGLTRNKDFAIQLLNDLFKISSNYQELKKSVSFFITTRYFDFFFKHFLHSKAGWSCTLTCMLLYRGACGPFKENLEKHLKIETGKNAKISSKVAHCYALLPSVGGGGNEGICYEKNWRTWFAKFLSIVHSLLKDLFSDVEELQEYEIPEHLHDENQNENSPAYLTIQIHNHCSVLSCMLLSEYPAPKSIPTDLIFQLLCRGLAVTPKALENRSTTEILSLKKVLPEIHCSFMSLLKAVIVTCKSQLLPYSLLVCKLISQTLEWTESEFTYGKEKPFRRLRESAYEALCNWVAVTGNGSCAEVISSAIISNAVSDITTKKKVISLKGNPYRLPHYLVLPMSIILVLHTTLYEMDLNYVSMHSSLSYRPCQFWDVTKGHETILTNIPSDVLETSPANKTLLTLEAKHQNQSRNRQRTPRRISAVADARLCHSALKALQFLLKFAGVSLKAEEHKFLQEFAVKLILQVQKSVSDVMVPFDVSSCRLELYALLLELTLQPCPKWPPPTHFALRLLERGQNDVCPQICSLCSTALSVMTIIIHPQYNNGGFPSCETPENKSHREVQLQWKVSAETDHVKPCMIEENVVDSSGGEICQARFEGAGSSESGEVGSKEKVNNIGDESSAASCSGDSRTTVTFSKNASNSSNDSLNEVEETKEKCSPEMISLEDEPSPKIQKTTMENSPADDQQPLESPSAYKAHENKLGESDQLKPSSSAKSLSPESACEEGQVKKRYFLRSKTKGSSEEPEEGIKRAVSLDSLKSTSVRNSPRGSPNVPSSAKRPRTRALSKVETNGDAELNALKKTPDDDEDILATFDDSFVD